MPRIPELVEELDRLIPKEGAKLRIPADPDGNVTVGTHLGYLRLGIELLRAGLSPIATTAPEVPRITLDIDYLLTPDSDTPFDLCEIDDKFEQRPPRVTKLGPLGQLVAALGMAALLGVLIVAAVAVLSRLFV